MRIDRTSLFLWIATNLLFIICYVMVYKCQEMRETQRKAKYCPAFTYLGESYEEGKSFYEEDSADPTAFYVCGLNVCEEGAIPDAKTAVLVAVPILNSMYGERTIHFQQPYDVTLVNDKYWCIEGTRGFTHAHGGTFFLILRKSDGKAMYVSHDK